MIGRYRPPTQEERDFLARLDARPPGPISTFFTAVGQLLAGILAFAGGILGFILFFHLLKFLWSIA